MASLHLSPLLLLLLSFPFLLISPSQSLTCTSQTFTNNHLYTDCADLPTLSAFLHWTYNSSKSSLSVAFIAPPAKSDGWIAWAINPTGTGMAGAQALVAYKLSNGSMTVDTYNLSSYSSIIKSNLSFDVSAKSGEYSGGVMRIFATVAVPEGAASLNQVWQVGGSVTGGVPDRHEFQAANLNAKGTLDLVAGSTKSLSPASAPAPASGGPVSGPSPTTGGGGPSGGPVSGLSPTTGGGGPSGGNNGSGVSSIRNGGFGFFVVLFVTSFMLNF